MVFGVVILMTGSLGLFAFGYLPRHAAVNSCPDVSLSLKGIVLSAVFVLLGAVALLPIGPASVSAPSPDGRMPRPWREWIFIAVMLSIVAGAVGYYLWLRSFLRQQGLRSLGPAEPHPPLLPFAP